MANIELVIKIPEEMYKWVCDVNKFSNDYGTGDFIDLIKNGTLLSKHHGRLINADKLIRDTIKNPVHAPYIHIIDMKEAPTIIEAEEVQDADSD